MANTFLLNLILVTLAVGSALSLRQVTRELIKATVWPEQSYHGVIHVSDIPIADLFYWWFPSRRSRTNDPLIIWYSGGPSCGDEIALFLENGPFKFDMKTSKLSHNPLSWNNQANLLYIDQPLGTGFSQTHMPDSDLPTNEDQVSNQMRQFLLEFYKKFPEFNGRDLYLAGESFAGHYLPHFGSALLEMDPKIFNLKGVIYGDAYVNPNVQYDTFAQYAQDIGLITQDKYPELKSSLNHCEAMIRRGLFGGVEICLTITLGLVMDKNGKYILNIYNVKEPSLGPLMYDFSPLTRFLNSAPVKKSLDVSDRSWTPCSTPGHLNLVKDFVNNTAPLIGKILDRGIKVLAYNGEWDYVTNWLSGVAWTHSVDWSGKDEFAKQEMQSVGYGMRKSYKNFAFMKIFEAGHMMPMDQPEVAFKILTEFIGQDA